MMSCQYYHWDHGYACYKTGKNVNEDTYYYYCRDYDYGDCPIYKAESSSDSSGCFLTSACVEAMGLPDDCYELETLRKYRDTYLANCDGGMHDIHEYYFIAPQIVEKINQSDNSKAVWKKIYAELVLPCVKLIESEENNQARVLYKSYTMELKKEYLLG